MTAASQPVPLSCWRRALESRALAVALVSAIAALLLLYYVPVLFWLGLLTAQVSQIYTGGVLVIVALAVCLRRSLASLRIQPSITDDGLALIVLAMATLWLAGRLNFWPVPIVLLSFCFALAAIITFVFGNVGVRLFLPALGAFVVFGIMLSLFPQLDWPLRKLSARLAAAILALLGVPVQLGVVTRGPAELVIMTKQYVFWVATECNGFGLLASALLLATILAFHHRLITGDKIELIVLALPAAVLCNCLRIVTICLLAPRFQTHYHALHETVGAAYYYAALILIWLLAERYASWKPTPTSQQPTPVLTTPTVAPVENHQSHQPFDRSSQT
jgi:exosortase/archaeosortase family protein